MGQVAFLLEERSMEAFPEKFIPRFFPDLPFLCIAHNGKNDLEKSCPRKLRFWGDLVYGQVDTIRLYCRSHCPSQSRRGLHVPEIRIAPERSRTANLDRIAKGRYGRQRPPMWQVERARARLKCDAGLEGAGTDEAVADALDVSAGSVGRWRCQAVAEDPEAVLKCQAKTPRSSRLDGAGEAHLLQWAQSTPPARRVGHCGRWPASGRRGGLCPVSVTRRCAACQKTN